MAVENLPREIQDNILMHLMYGEGERVLTRPGFSKHESPCFTSGSGKYASVSKRWQEVVEREVFHTIRLTSDRMTEASKILTTTRQKYIRLVLLDAVLTEYGEELFAEVETEEEQEANNQIFTETVAAFFDLISNWDPQIVESANITVALDVYSFGDETHGNSLFLERVMGRAPDIFEDRFEKSTIEMKSMEALPTLNSITSFDNTVRRNVQRNVSAATCCDFASKLPQLKTLSLTVTDHDYYENRRELRKVFGECLIGLPESIKEFSLEYKVKADGKSVVDGSEDPFSLALRKFSRRLERLYVHDGVIGDEFFWSPIPREVREEPYWPHLTTCHFVYATTTPSGLGRFEYDSESYPNTPNKPTDQLNNLYTAAAKAALQMPQLRELMMGPAQERIYHTFLYRVDESRSAAQAMWIACPVYKPEAPVLQLWKDVAMMHTGTELKVFIGKTPDHLITPPDEETRMESLLILKAFRKTLTALDRPLI